MSDANTGQTVECPICETSFDPTVAGGWCTNTDCGEWQYTDGGEGALVDESAAGDEDVADDAAAEADESDDEADESADGPDVSPIDPDGEADAETAAADDASDVDDAETAGAESVEADADGSVEADDAEQVEADEDGPAEVDDAEPVATEADDSAEVDDQPSTIDCPDCGSTLDAEVNFCPDCGTDVRDLEPDAPLTECPSCDSDVDPDDNFCVNCGEDLTAHRNGETDAETVAGDSADTETVDGSEASDDTEAEDAVDALESAEPVPDSLVLDVVGREIAVDDGDKVGREIRAALTDAGRPEDEAVRIHREHVRFVREDDSFYLLDLGDNPTELNGQALQKGDREPVAPGDEIELSGVATVTVRAP